MCGCSNVGAQTGGGGAAGTPVYQSPVSQASPYIASPGQNPAQTNVNDGSVRNAALAERTIERLKFATRNLQTPEQARAAGYHPNPSAPDHWINDSIFKTRNGYDLDKPATLMFENNRLVGVMLSHNQRTLGPPPDLGAGTWHTHGGTAGEEFASHVWLNKPLQSAFGKETGDV
ncbi:MAG: hypothetical protein JWM86_2433 [Thermoleophilia bacterium]|nr:hypothetical protein [Thermoleophilia bacterium]